MKRSRIIVITTATLALGAVLVGGAAATHAAGRAFRHGMGGAGHERILRAIVDTKLEMVAAELGLDAPQKARLEKVKESLLAKVASQKEEREAARDQFLEAFQKETLDRATLEQLGETRKQHMESMKGAVIDAILEVHDTLTPEQRVKLAEHIESRFGPCGVH